MSAKTLRARTGMILGGLALLGASALLADTPGGMTLPNPVIVTLLRFGNGGTIESVAKKNEGDLPVYAVKLNNNGTKMDIQTTLEGDLCSTEEAVGTDEMPPFVARAARKAFPKGVTAAARTITVMYKVTGLDAGGHVREAWIALPGTALVEAPGASGEQGSDAKKGKS